MQLGTGAEVYDMCRSLNFSTAAQRIVTLTPGHISDHLAQVVRFAWIIGKLRLLLASSLLYFVLLAFA